MIKAVKTGRFVKFISQPPTTRKIIDWLEQTYESRTDWIEVDRNNIGFQHTLWIWQVTLFMNDRSCMIELGHDINELPRKLRIDDDLFKVVIHFDDDWDFAQFKIRFL